MPIGIYNAFVDIPILYMIAIEKKKEAKFMGKKELHVFVF